MPESETRHQEYDSEVIVITSEYQGHKLSSTCFLKAGSINEPGYLQVLSRHAQLHRHSIEAALLAASSDEYSA